MLYCLEYWFRPSGQKHNTYRVTLLWHDEAETKKMLQFWRLGVKQARSDPRTNNEQVHWRITASYASMSLVKRLCSFRLRVFTYMPINWLKEKKTWTSFSETNHLVDITFAANKIQCRDELLALARVQASLSLLSSLLVDNDDNNWFHEHRGIVSNTDPFTVSYISMA